MCRTTIIPLLLLMLQGMLWAQAPNPAQTQTTVCTFEDGKEISVKYQAAPVKHEKLTEGTRWSPGKTPMFLFTAVPVKLADTEIPVGAYSMYVIPGKKQWTLIVNKNVSSNKYDENEDVVRANMDTGSLGAAEKNVSVVFAHVAPKQCSM